MKKILKTVDTDVMVIINKGIAVFLTCIQSIEDGVYRMMDGREIKGRVRTSREHKRNKTFVRSINSALEKEGSDSDIDVADITPQFIEEKLESNEPVDFIFRYLKK